MKKLFLILLLALIFGSGFSMKNVTDPLYENVREQAIEAFKGMFSGEVKIGRAGGRILGRIDLYEVEIGPDIKADRIVIKFNVLEYLAKKMDITQAISEIRISGGYANIVRDKKGNINAANFMQAPEPDKPAGPAFAALIFLESAKADFTDEAGLPYKGKALRTYFTELKGLIDMRKAPKLALTLTGKVEGQDPVSIKGRVDLNKFDFDFKIKANRVPVQSWGNWAIPGLELGAGQVDLDLNINNDSLAVEAEGRLDGIDASTKTRVDFKSGEVISTITVSKGEYAGIDFSGSCNLALRNNVLKVSQAKASVYGGELSTSGEIDLKTTRFSLKGDFDGLDIENLQAPNVSGRASGDVALSGTFSNFSGHASASFREASAFGQPVKNGLVELVCKDGDCDLTRFELVSDNSIFSGSGRVDRQGKVVITSLAQGLEFKGSGVIGDMHAHLNSFTGKIAFTLNDDFYNNPLKNISAAGSFEVVEARLGEQTIDLARGEIDLDHGVIEVKDTIVRDNSNAITLQGKIGLGSNDLSIAGLGLDLSKLRILDYILPENIYGVSGTADLSIRIYGDLDKIQELDSFFDLSATAGVRIREGEASGVRIREVSLEADYKDRGLMIKNAFLRTNNSALSLNFYLGQNDYLVLRAKGFIDLIDFRPLLLGSTNIFGTGTLDLDIVGPRTSPDGSARFSLKRFRFNEISFDEISAGVEIKKGLIHFTRPAMLTSRENRIVLSGSVQLDPALEKSQANLKMEVLRGSLRDISKLFQDLYFQLGRLIAPVESKRISLKVPDIRIPPISDKQVFLTRGSETPILKVVGRLEEQVRAGRMAMTSPVLERMDGKLKAVVSLTGELRTLSIDAKLSVEDGQYGKYAYDQLKTEVLYEDNIFFIDNLTLRKGEGWLAVAGEVDLGLNEMNLSFRSDDFPIDILELAANKKMMGGCDIQGRAYGPFAKPQFSFNLATGPVKLAGVGYDRIAASADWDGRTLTVKRLELEDAAGKSSATGYYSSNGKGELTASLEGNSLGLLNLFNDEVLWKSGRAKGNVHLTIDRGRETVEGKLAISDATVYVKAINSDLQKVHVDLSVQDNVIAIDRLLGYWASVTSQSKVNYLSLYGYIDLNQEILSLRLFDTKLTPSLVGIYRGELGLTGITLAGRFDNLILSGNVEMANGVLFLPDNPEAAAVSGKTFPLSFDLTLNLKQNMYLTGGNVLTLNLSNIMFNLEMYGEDLKLSGAISSPKLGGRIFFKRGTVNILSREFVLLNPERQKSFYPYELDRAENNYAHFTGEGIMPYLNLVALVNVETSEKSSDDPGQTIRKQVYIISRIKGLIGASDRERGVKLNFEAFEEKNFSEYVRASYSEDQIKVLLLPDFVKSIAGIDGGNGEKVDSNAVVADYLSSRLQTVVFRGLERQIEQALGLTSLTLEYNFGSDIRRAMGVQEVQVGKPTLGVSFVKGFFDRLYIDVKYAQWEGDATTGGMDRTNLNYQLTYKLSPTFSLVYYREPLSLDDLQSGPSQVSLTATVGL